MDKPVITLLKSQAYIGVGRKGSHHGMEEFLAIKYMLMGGI